jgi:quercetin dioxygenase-like cupin family protein
MEIKRSGSQRSSKGPADWFSGTVRIDPLFQANDPARTSGASVTFEPGARTVWHTHLPGNKPLPSDRSHKSHSWYDIVIKT